MTDCLLKILAVRFWKGGSRRDHFNTSFSILLCLKYLHSHKGQETVRLGNWNMEWAWNYPFEVKWVLTHKKERRWYPVAWRLRWSLVNTELVSCPVQRYTGVCSGVGVGEWAGGWQSWSWISVVLFFLAKTMRWFLGCNPDVTTETRLKFLICLFLPSFTEDRWTCHMSVFFIVSLYSTFQNFPLHLDVIFLLFF